MPENCLSIVQCVLYHLVCNVFYELLMEPTDFFDIIFFLGLLTLENDL